MTISNEGYATKQTKFDLNFKYNKRYETWLDDVNKYVESWLNTQKDSRK